MPREAQSVITRFGMDVRLPADTTTEEATKLSAMVLEYLREEFNSIGTTARIVSRPSEVTIGLEGVEVYDVLDPNAVTNTAAGVHGYVEGFLNRDFD